MTYLYKCPCCGSLLEIATERTARQCVNLGAEDVWVEAVNIENHDWALLREGSRPALD